MYCICWIASSDSISFASAVAAARDSFSSLTPSVSPLSAFPPTLEKSNLIYQKNSFSGVIAIDTVVVAANNEIPPTNPAISPTFS